MQPRIVKNPSRKMVGMKLEMSYVQDKTVWLWQSFMSRRREISDILSDDKFSIQVYKEDYFNSFSRESTYIKWAAVEVEDYRILPSGMEAFTLESGPYAIFHYKGLSSDKSIFQYIYNDWLPRSEYTLDNRPHFEVLGEKYKNNDPDSEEEIWIPIK
jgi:AraC family transcriptional regulator